MGHLGVSGSGPAVSLAAYASVNSLRWGKKNDVQETAYPGTPAAKVRTQFVPVSQTAIGFLSHVRLSLPIQEYASRSDQEEYHHLLKVRAAGWPLSKLLRPFRLNSYLVVLDL